MVLWQEPFETLNLKPDHVDIWRFSTDQLKIEPLLVQNWLSKSEKLRATKFRFKRDYLNFVVGHLALKLLIYHYSGFSLRKRDFDFNDQGKPLIPSAYRLSFNLSHTDHQIIIAFTKIGNIGVDIENFTKEIEVEKLAKSFFATSEVNALMHLPKEDQQKSFYECWTRKEAFIKAKGGGLSVPLKEFTVTLGPKTQPQLLSINWDKSDVKNWSMISFSPYENYIAACIMRLKEPIFKFFEGNGLLENRIEF